MKLSKALKDAEQRLTEAAVPEAEFDARALAAHILGVKLSGLTMQRDRLLTGEELAAFEALVHRRAQREPLQYLLGTVEFYGREFLCDHRALIPRADTETLIDVSLELIAELGITRLADIGVGTGVIALTLAHEAPELSVLATDASEDALELAAENMAMHEMAERVSLARGEWLAPLHEEGVAEEIEMIVSNPPYIRAEDFAALMPEIVEHEPREALVDSDPDGMGSCRIILEQCLDLPALRAVAFEVGKGQAGAVADLMSEKLDAREVIIRKDLGRIDRVVAAVTGLGES